jgi:tRNA-specific 2-thiouridylase
MKVRHNASVTRVVAAMSGGVDSAVVAGMLKQQGYDVIGVTLRLWAPEDEALPRGNRHCCTLDDLDDARIAAHQLGIPHYVLNMERAFQERVVDYFVDEYRRGRTPNPCIACNEHIKFGALIERADALGAGYVATGHYARIEERDGAFRLLRAVDADKDQSYVLYSLGQRELSRVMFPLGDLPSKADTRATARSLGLHLAEKQESADVCFVPDGDTHAFVAGRVGSRPGDVVDIGGRILGKHEGATGYTIGQRRGLGVATGERSYVVGLDVDANIVTIGPEEALLSDWALAEDPRWVARTALSLPLTADAKIRYRAAALPASIEPAGDEVLVHFKRPARAVTPGQAIVFYEGDQVLGGATIRESGRGQAGAHDDSGSTLTQPPVVPRLSR